MLNTNIDTSISQLSLLSYNTCGWNSFKSKMINDLLISEKNYILAIQEHMMLPQNIHKIQDSFSDFELFAIPAFKANTHISRGRPSGGLGFVFHKNLSKMIVRLNSPDSNRVQGLRLNFSNDSYVLINSYFPVDKRDGNIDELLRVLQDIKYIIDLCDDNCKIILLGDLNCDFNRDTIFCNHVKDFCEENSLISIWSKFDCDFTHSQTKLVNGVERTYFSSIDHFCVKNDFLKDCIESFPLHTPENLSNHEPIFLKFNCRETTLEGSGDIPIKINTQSRPIWDRASQFNLDNYKLRLQQLICNIDVPVVAITCTDVHCLCADHKIVIDQ